MQDVSIRHGQAKDVAALCTLFYRSVQEGTRDHYTQEQVNAWAPAPPDPETWTERLAAQSVFLAERGDRILGFMTLTGEGYIDLAFVDPDYAGSGIAYRLYQALEVEARATGLCELSSNASALARPFFLRQGWSVEAKQIPVIRGVALYNYRMKKRLDA